MYSTVLFTPFGHIVLAWDLHLWGDTPILDDYDFLNPLLEPLYYEEVNLTGKQCRYTACMKENNGW